GPDPRVVQRARGAEGRWGGGSGALQERTWAARRLRADFLIGSRSAGARKASGIGRCFVGLQGRAEGGASGEACRRAPTANGLAVARGTARLRRGGEPDEISGSCGTGVAQACGACQATFARHVRPTLGGNVMRRHFGILVPSANTTCEIEFCRLPEHLQ